MLKATGIKIACYWNFSHAKETAICMAAYEIRRQPTFRTQRQVAQALVKIDPELLREAQKYNAQLRVL